MTRHRLMAAVLVVFACVASVGPVAATDSDTSYIWPTRGRVTQPYGCTGFWAEPRHGSCRHFHGGIDIANSRGTPVRAAADGVIELVGWDPWLRRNPDWMVIIDHGRGVKTVYAHLRAKPIDGIRRGEPVSQGQLIGLMDMTGMATGPHLHLSFIVNGEWANPRDFIAGLPSRRRPVGSTIASPSGASRCDIVGAGMGAWNGGLTAVALEGDGPSPCAA